MKKLLVTFVFFAALVAFGSCEKPNPSPDKGKEEQPDIPDTPDTPDQPDQPDVPDDSPYFKANVQDLYAFNCGSEGLPPGFEILYETNVDDWTVTSDAPWCKATKETSRILVDLEPYLPTYENGQYMYLVPRTCSVTIAVKDIFNKTFQVLQESKTGFTVPYEPVLISPAGGTVDVTLRNNCYDWTVEIDRSLSGDDDGSWLTLKKKDAITLTITSSPRPAGVEKARKVWVRVNSVLDSDSWGRFPVADSDAVLSGEDYPYDDVIDWD